MEPNPTLWQRFTSDTPAFFKKAQLIGISLAGLGTSLSRISGVPERLTTILISAGSAAALIAQFAVKPSDFVRPLNVDEPLPPTNNDETK